MSNPVPIRKNDGVELLPTLQEGIYSVHTTEQADAKSLSWDRYVRLNAAAEASKALALSEKRLLDVGGYDGALALFLPEFNVDLIDQATTGASILQAPAADKSYELVTAIDVLEHIPPRDRQAALGELARMSSRFIVLNYPCSESKNAQELVYRQTNNSLIKEHVEWELPNTEQVLNTMQQLGFRGHVIGHSSVAIWVGQYITLALAPQAAKELNRYLIENHADEPFSIPLYHLLVCERMS
ncbi:MAG: class I SAM-dependent methyltransferase [Candidatus Obscuribacterales bacterium]|nr:class I SAM-dependent methyltransferase [Candidatus Obscuribacterales bacterium]